MNGFKIPIKLTVGLTYNFSDSDNKKRFKDKSHQGWILNTAVFEFNFSFIANVGFKYVIHEVFICKWITCLCTQII